MMTMNTKLKYLPIAAFAAVALSLSGCGSNGDDSPVASPGDPPTTPTTMPEPTPVAVMIPNAMYLDADNMPKAGTVMLSAGASYTSGGVMFSCPAGEDACEVTVAADGSVTSTGGVATASLTDDAVTQVAQAKKAAQDEADRAALENRDRIIGKDRAIEAAMNLGLTGTANMVDEDEILISRGAGAMARVRVTGYSPHEDPALPNPGWAGTRLMQPVAGTGTNHLFVYTDIEAPTLIQFYNWDGDSTTPRLYADVAMDGLTAPATTATPIPGLALTAANFSAATADMARFPAPLSVEEGSDTQNYPNNDDTDNNPGNGFEQVSIPGNYNGAGGRYLCTGGSVGTPCSVTVNPAGAYTLVATWTFVPQLNSTAWAGGRGVHELRLVAAGADR